MKVPSAALLFLASFGTTISSSNAKMVEFQVSSDGETNKQKKNVRKLQDGVGTIGECIISNECKEKCADLYCACADDCDQFFNSDVCKCADDTAGGSDLLFECQKICAPNCNNEQKRPIPQEKVEAKSSRAPESREVQGKRFLNDRDDEFNWDEFFQCKDDVPTKSPSPSMTPSISSAPSTSTAPTTDCGIIDCDMTHSASCNPDPHYSVWSGTVSYYDFQGSCDQIAIDNSNLQLQMKTRGRGYYSTITEVALKMKGPGELLQVDGTNIISNNITSASLGASVEDTSSYVNITFPTPAGDSYIKINLNSYGISIQVYGIGYIFGGSEGMLGSWNNGGVNFQNGTAFDLSGGYADVKARSFKLAESWAVPLGANNYLPNPSDTCVPESICLAGDTDCSTRRLEVKDVVPDCKRTCFETPLKDTCFTDLALSLEDGTIPCSESFALDSLEIFQCYEALQSNQGVDPTWACQETYINPVIVRETLANFRPQGSEMCMADDDICSNLGGYCAPDCVDGPSTVCVPFLCSSAKPVKMESASEKKETKAPKSDRRLKKGKNDEEKMPKASKTPKATKSPKSSVECMCKVQRFI